MQSTCDPVVRADRTALATQEDRSGFSATITPEAPSHSRTFLAGRARPPREALAAPVPLQSIVTNAIVTGTFCRGDTNTTVKPARSHQQSLAAISLSALFLIHQTAIKKMSQEYKKKMSQEYQVLIPHCQAKKPRNRPPASTCCSLGGSRMGSTCLV